MQVWVRGSDKLELRQANRRAAMHLSASIAGHMDLVARLQDTQIGFTILRDTDTSTL